MTVFLTENGKMKETTEANPGYRFVNTGITPGKTCPGAGECSKWCFGKHGMYVFDTVKAAYEWRYQQTLLDSFVDEMCAAIEAYAKRAAKKEQKLVVRVHDVGDYYSKEYIKKWWDIFARNTNVIFYSYTKSVSMMKDFIKENGLPENFIVIYSHGGKEDDLILPTDRQSKMIPRGEDIPDGWEDATGNDMVALKERYIALPYH